MSHVSVSNTRIAVTDWLTLNAVFLEFYSNEQLIIQSRKRVTYALGLTLPSYLICENNQCWVLSVGNYHLFWFYNIQKFNENITPCILVEESFCSSQSDFQNKKSSPSSTDSRETMTLLENAATGSSPALTRRNYLRVRFHWGYRKLCYAKAIW